MNKSQLIDAVAKKVNLPKKSITQVIDTVLDKITMSLAKGDIVALMGFGSFSVKERASRIGRNPQTGEYLNIKASKIPYFKAGKAFKNAVDKSKKIQKENSS